MTYHQQASNNVLKQYIRCFWWLDNDSSKNLNYTILPDGFFDIIVRFDNYKYQSTVQTGLYTQEVKVIMLTALDDPRSVFEAYYRGGATSYLTKPLKRKDLLDELVRIDLLNRDYTFL